MVVEVVVVVVVVVMVMVVGVVVRKMDFRMTEAGLGEGCNIDFDFATLLIVVILGWRVLKFIVVLD